MFQICYLLLPNIPEKWHVSYYDILQVMIKFIGSCQEIHKYETSALSFRFKLH